MRSLIFSFFLLTVSVSALQATHLRCGHISVGRLNPTSNTCVVTLTVFTSTKNTPVKVGGDVDVSYINFGDGTRHFVPEQAGYVRYDLDPNGGISSVTYHVDHTYPGPGNYTLYYQEPNRNAGILNLDNSITTLFYLETAFTLDEDFKATPFLLTNPIFYGVLEETFEGSVAAIDSSGYALYYEMTTPMSAPSTDVVNYRLPSSFAINKFNGHITWDTKFNNVFTAGEFAFATKTSQFKGEKLISYIKSDFQIILDDGNAGKAISGKRVVDANSRVYVPFGTTVKLRVFLEDEFSEELQYVWFTELKNLWSISFSSYDSTQGERHIKVGVIEVSNTQFSLRDNPYVVLIRGVYRSGTEYKDLTYLVYTKDTQLPEPPEIVLSTAEEVKSIRVYPNPVTDFLLLDQEGVRSVSIYSTDGIMTDTQRPKDKRVDLRGLKAGLYIIKIDRGTQGREFVRVVKE